MPPHLRVVSAALRVAACLLAAIAVGGCASSSGRVFDPGSSSFAPGRGSLTEKQFKAAVAVARAEVAKDNTISLTSATATVGPGTVTDANDGPPCTSGTLLHIKLIGSFNIAVGGAATDSPPSASAATDSAASDSAGSDSAGSDSAASGSAALGALPTDGGSYSVTAVLITADPASGEACLLGVQIAPATPDPGATLLFTH